MRRSLVVPACGLAILVTTSAIAGSAGLGQVTQFTANQSVFFFVTNGPRFSQPSCATSTNRWALDVSTNIGQATAALIMSAQAQGKQVSVFGTGNCSLWGDTETVEHIDIPTS